VTRPDTGCGFSTALQNSPNRPPRAEARPAHPIPTSPLRAGLFPGQQHPPPAPRQRRHRQEPGFSRHSGERRRDHRRPPRTTSATTSSQARLRPAPRAKITYERSCHRCVTIIQSRHRTTTILKVAAAHRRPGRSWKGIPGQRRFRDSLRSHVDRHRASPQARRKDTINDNAANRTPVRAETPRLGQRPHRTLIVALTRLPHT
jgi:hypothetical protein